MSEPESSPGGPEPNESRPEPQPPPDDLTPERLAGVLGDRPLNSYAEITSTEIHARKWSREGAPDRALVVAAHQAGPRGRSGLSWGELLEPGHGVGFSLLRRDDHRTGWLYLAGLLGLAEGMGDDELTLEWPDQVRRGDRIAGAVSVRPAGKLESATVISVVVPGAEPPRTDLVGRLVEAVEARLDGDPDEVLAAYRDRCATLGRRVRVRLLPLGPSAQAPVGEASELDPDGALVVEVEDGEPITVAPDELGFLEDPDEDDLPPDDDDLPDYDPPGPD